MAKGQSIQAQLEQEATRLRAEEAAQQKRNQEAEGSFWKGAPSYMQQVPLYDPEQRAFMNLARRIYGPQYFDYIDRQYEESQQPLLNQMLGNQGASLANYFGPSALANLLQGQEGVYPNYGGDTGGLGGLGSFGELLGGALGGMGVNWLAQGGGQRLADYLRGPAPMQQEQPQQPRFEVNPTNSPAYNPYGPQANQMVEPGNPQMGYNTQTGNSPEWEAAQRASQQQIDRARAKTAGKLVKGGFKLY